MFSFKNNNKKIFAIVFFLAFILALLLLLPNIISNKGVLIFNGDYLGQQIPFNTYISEVFTSGLTNFTLMNDLGGEFISSFSFYNLASPFSLLGYIFPSSFMVYLMGPILMLKFAFAALTCAIFFNKYIKNKKLLIIGGLLYAFTGFQIGNMPFYHFHDVIVIFPLLLWSLDKLFEGKRGVFALILGLSAIINYVFFFGEVLFIFIYMIVKLITKQYDIKKLVNFFIEFILGILLSMIIIWPSAYNLLSNPRLGSMYELKDMFLYPFTLYLKIFQSFIIPSDIPSYITLLRGTNWQSCEAYIPLFGVLLGLTYLVRKPKNWLSILSFILIIFIFVPILNSSFMLFNSLYYARWFFMFLLIFILISIKALDDELKPHLQIYILIFSIYILFCTLYFRIYNDILIIKSYSIISYLVALGGLILSFILIKRYYKNKKVILMIIGIFASVLISGYNFIFNFSSQGKTYEILEHAYDNRDIIEDDSLYRVKFTNCPLNINYMFNIPTIESFNSSINGSLFGFYKSIDMDRRQITNYNLDNYGYYGHLGVKYVISCESEIESDSLVKLYDQDIFTVYENKYFKPFAYTYDNYISNDYFMKLSENIKKRALIDSMVIVEDEIDDYDKYFNEVIYGDVTNDGDTYKINIELNYEDLIYISLPYDKNFKAYNNVKEAKIYKVNNGFMAIKGVNGKNNIELVYINNQYKKGTMISILSLVLIIIYSNRKMFGLKGRGKKYEEK